MWSTVGYMTESPAPQDRYGPEQVASFFATNARTRREELGLSQGEVARRMADAGYKFHQATVYKVEQNQRVVSMVEAFGLARVLGQSVQWLMAPPEVEGLVSALRRERLALLAVLDELAELGEVAYEHHEKLLRDFRRADLQATPALEVEWAEAADVLAMTPLDAMADALQRWREWGWDPDTDGAAVEEMRTSREPDHG